MEAEVSSKTPKDFQFRGYVQGSFVFSGSQIDGDVLIAGEL